MLNDNAIKDYLKNGYTISEPTLDTQSISNIRLMLDEEFGNLQGGNSIPINNFKNIDLIKKILKILTSNQIKTKIENLKKITNLEVSLLPRFEVHKNYHVNLKEFHGWHRDCGGELKYKYCADIIGDKNYLFSKVGIYLQDNSEYGGSIDIIKKSHKNFSKLKILLRKIKSIPLRLVMFFHKKFNNVYFSIPENFFMFFLNAKRLFPQKSSAVFFDSRIIHRGSPISKDKLKDVKYFRGKYEAKVPKDKDKYTIYCQFGSSQSVDSYMYDRLRRGNNSEELKRWLEEMEFISKFDIELSNQIGKILNPIKNKYKDYLN